ncbi:hypothetical protein [Colwellia hornerae]|uniref:Uncharacterized protein n=1 Tax=Colwellia hornerae TaxID=89402 RepID=A0A5C6QTH9_9GAMM|nr:hypothetical protein [Colwellia hornerae]TWX56861.1 hypothetical protein ESZ28_03660 [Colwellia hornerae]TWX62414.1 hypothetical protein ESZ26_03230 [Colwellia hornerae]TWX72254.1 hypothetical protein ESZ27_00135 [Colwellia hornerae]
MLFAAMLSVSVVATSAATVHHTPSFKVVNQAESAQVFPLNTELPFRLWKKACHRALSYPLRVEKQQQLAKQLNLTLPDKINYATSHLSNYQEKRIEGGLSCSGLVTETKPDLNKAMLALINAWWALEQGETKFLKPLLQLSMANLATRNDSIILIASQTGGKKGKEIFEQQANDINLLLNASKAALASFWLEQGNYQPAIDMLANCDSKTCYQLQRKVNMQKELKDEQTADDLASYF